MHEREMKRLHKEFSWLWAVQSRWSPRLVEVKVVRLGGSFSEEAATTLRCQLWHSKLWLYQTCDDNSEVRRLKLSGNGSDRRRQLYETFQHLGSKGVLARSLVAVSANKGVAGGKIITIFVPMKSEPTGNRVFERMTWGM